jgi:hypothetical protein
LSSIRPANHHRVKPGGNSPGQPLNRVFERHRIWFRTSAAPSPRAFSTTPGTVRRCCPALVAARRAAASPAAQPSNSFMHTHRRPAGPRQLRRPACDGRRAASRRTPWGRRCRSGYSRPCGRAGQPLPAGGLDQRILPRCCRRHRASPGRRPAFRLPATAAACRPGPASRPWSAAAAGAVEGTAHTPGISPGHRRPRSPYGRRAVVACRDRVDVSLPMTTVPRLPPAGRGDVHPAYSRRPLSRRVHVTSL